MLNYQRVPKSTISHTNPIPSFFWGGPLFRPQRPPWGSPRSENVAPAAAPEVPRNEGHGLDRRPQGPVNSGEFQGLLASRTTCCWKTPGVNMQKWLVLGAKMVVEAAKMLVLQAKNGGFTSKILDLTRKNVHFTSKIVTSPVKNGAWTSKNCDLISRNLD